MNHPSFIRQAPRLTVLLTAAITAALAGCSSGADREAERHASSTDTNMQVSASTPAAGAAQVTRTDSRSVTASTEYELTPDNFTKLVRANEALAALTARDAQARSFLEQNTADAAARDMDAGIRLLLSQPAVRSTIENAGISVPDFFVASVAVASARRFINNPDAAPPTPATRKNAEFLRAHHAELRRLDEAARATSRGAQRDTASAAAGGSGQRPTP